MTQIDRVLRLQKETGDGRTIEEHQSHPLLLSRLLKTHNRLQLTQLTLILPHAVINQGQQELIGVEHLESYTGCSKATQDVMYFRLNSPRLKSWKADSELWECVLRKRSHSVFFGLFCFLQSLQSMKTLLRWWMLCSLWHNDQRLLPEQPPWKPQPS